MTITDIFYGALEFLITGVAGIIVFGLLFLFTVFVVKNVMKIIEKWR